MGRTTLSFNVQWFRVLGASFSSLGCSVFDFRELGASFSRFGCFVLRSSFSSASFSKLPWLIGSSQLSPLERYCSRVFYRSCDSSCLSLHRRTQAEFRLKTSSNALPLLVAFVVNPVCGISSSSALFAL